MEYTITPARIYDLGTVTGRLHFFQDHPWLIEDAEFKDFVDPELLALLSRIW